MKIVAVAAFVVGLLLAVRIMFFGVQRRLDEDNFALRRWPLALAAFLVFFGAVVYVREARSGGISAAWMALALVIAALAAVGAWWLVQRSATMPSTDPEDDPQFRFQGHVARVLETIPSAADGATGRVGRIGFEFDGKRYEFRARWTPGDWAPAVGQPDSEVVIERVDDDLAYVEPWSAIEERL